MQGQTQPPSQQHLQPEEAAAPKWYDRILDVLLGEDEMSAKARLALICKNCRMVNGLAPPGTRSLEEMEQWGCARCGTMNGKKPRSVIDEKRPMSRDHSEHREPARRITRGRSNREDSESEGSTVDVDDNEEETPLVKQDGSEEETPLVKQDGCDEETLLVKQEGSEEETPRPKRKVKAKARRKA